MIPGNFFNMRRRGNGSGGLDENMTGQELVKVEAGDGYTGILSLS